MTDNAITQAMDRYTPGTLPKVWRDEYHNFLSVKCDDGLLLEHAEAEALLATLWMARELSELDEAGWLAWWS